LKVFANFDFLKYLKYQDMKNLTLITVLLLFAVLVFPDSKITRGPNVGEIYFIGPTHTGLGLYYSTDFGETAVCVDSTMDILTIAADVVHGGIYCVDMPHNLYYSSNYGNNGTWVFKNGAAEISEDIESGINSGRIFSNFYMHSEDYGSNFIYHNSNGYFGSTKNAAIDIINDSIGYVLSFKLNVGDSLYLFRTFDQFENLELIQTLNYNNGEHIYLSCGNKIGEIYLFNKNRKQLFYSNDFSVSFISVEKFNLNNYYSIDIVAGKTNGEFYILYNFINLMWQNAHIYIYHSIDNGKTFNVYHPFAKGNEPVLANFSTVEKEVHLTTPVEFCNYSIGDILEYQWDFDNNGTIDSYEESPIHIYQDTGWFSVKLSIVGPDSVNSFIKENYIHIIDTTTKIYENNFDSFSISPNPFNDRLTIISVFQSESYSIYIYNLEGEKVIDILKQNNKSFTINTSELHPGVYVLNISNQNYSSNYKIIKK